MSRKQIKRLIEILFLALLIGCIYLMYVSKEFRVFVACISGIVLLASLPIIGDYYFNDRSINDIYDEDKKYKQ